MIIHNLNPVLLDMGFFQLRWYGLMYVIAFILGYYLLNYLKDKFNVKLSKEDIGDYLLWAAIGMIVFSRLFEVFYYNPGYYAQNPFDVFAVWKGGLSFHGGMLGFIVVSYIFAKRKGISFLRLMDMVAIPATLGLVFGRIGNYINGELVGRASDVAWCHVFPKYDDVCRHPAQLYAAVKDVLLFSSLWYIKDWKKPDGFIAFSFLILYAVMRSVVEQFWRLPQGYIFGLTEGQFLNVFMLIAGVGGMWYIHTKK